MFYVPRIRSHNEPLTERSNMPNYNHWKVSGTYYEVCNCEAVCPCRRHGERKGGRSTYGNCDFALSWHITEGQADDMDLSNLSVVLVGSYHDDELGSPWRVIIYLDENGNTQQQQALSEIFLGRAGGETSENFAAAIGEVYAVRAAKIALEHSPNQERMEVTGFVSAATALADLTDQPVSAASQVTTDPARKLLLIIFG